MRFTIISLGVLATVMMTSVTATLGGVQGVTDAGNVGGVVDKVGDVGGVVDKVGDVGGITDKAGSALDGAGAGGVTDTLTDAQLENLYQIFLSAVSAASKLKDAAPASKSDAAPAALLEDAATASKSEAATLTSAAARRSFLARRNLGHAIHKRTATDNSENEEEPDEEEPEEDEPKENEPEENEGNEGGNTDTTQQASQGSIARRSSSAPI